MTASAKARQSRDFSPSAKALPPPHKRGGSHRTIDYCLSTILQLLLLMIAIQRASRHVCSFLSSGSPLGGFDEVEREESQLAFHNRVAIGAEPDKKREGSAKPV